MHIKAIAGVGGGVGVSTNSDFPANTTGILENIVFHVSGNKHKQ